MKHLVNWIEIPVLNLDRAVQFYSEILQDSKFYRMEMGGNEYALFPTQDKHNAGTLVKGEMYKPSADGVTIYLDGGNDLTSILQRVSKNGGTIIMDKTYFGNEAGYVGMFIDTEGNKIGLQHA
jgi:uncharacterized protein